MAVSNEDLVQLKQRLIRTRPQEFVAGLESGDIWPYSTLYNTLVDVEGIDSARVLTCDVLSIWLLRYTQTFKVVSKDLHTVSQEIALTKDAVDNLFQYITDFLEHKSGPFVNALSGLLTKLVELVKNCFVTEETALIFHGWVDVAMDLSITSRTIYQLTEVLAKNIDSQYILTKYPTFATNCISMMWSGALANAASKAIAAVYCGVYTRGNEAQWLDCWSDIVGEGLKNLELRKNIQTYLLPSLFTISAESYPLYMKRLQSSNLATGGTTAEDLDLLVGVAKIGQDLAISVEPFAGDEPVISMKLLINMLTHRAPHYRIGSFSLLVGSPKSSQPIPQYIYNTLINYNVIESFFMDHDETDIRNDFYSILRHFLIRVKDSSYSLNRDMQKLIKGNRDEVKQQQLKAFIESNHRFMNWFVGLLQESITPGSTYPQVSLGLQLLDVLVSLGVDSSVDLTGSSLKHSKAMSKSINSKMNFPFSIDLFNPTMVRLLADNVTNNYEDIRDSSVNILLACPNEKLTKLLSSPILSKSMVILFDLKGRKSEGGARVFQFLAQAYDRVHDESKIHRLCDALMERIESASDSIIDENIQPENRVQGVFTALRLVLSGIRKENFTHEYWTPLFNQLIGKYFPKFWHSVKPILSNVAEELNEVDDKLVLSYSWKLVKESTALLQTILNISNGHLDNTKFVLAVDMVIDQLSSVHHRGAFSSVYPTFVTCCELCFRSKDNTELPVKWLKNNVQLIEEKTQFISRRSGGLPYLITGILTANKNVNKKKTSDGCSELMKYSMSELLRIASIPYNQNADEKMDIPQVHAFNSMKHIFIDSQLSDECIYFVQEALTLSLLNCNSPTWAIRNCAVMLFTALQNRLFGTKKLGEILPTVSAKLFFVKYPGVSDILYTNLVDQSTNMEAVFPVLTILMRLEETSVEKPLLWRYEPLLHNFLEHKLWKIREMAARALAAIIKPNQLSEYSCKLVSDCDNGSLNRRHGSLLTILEIFKRIKLRLPDVEVSSSTIDMLNERINLFIPKRASTFSWAPGKVFVDILLAVQPRELPISTMNVLGTYILDTLNSPERIEGARQLLLADSIELVLNQQFIQESFTDAMDLSRLCILSDGIYEAQLTAISLCKKNLIEISKHVDSLEVLDLYEDTWKIVSDESCWSLVRSTALGLLKSLLHYKELQPNEVVPVIETLFAFTDKEMYSEDVNSMALETLGPLVTDVVGTGQQIMVSKFLNLVSGFSHDERPFTVRIAAIKAAISFLLKMGNDTSKYTAEASFLVYTALSDDDGDIRDIAADYFSSKFQFQFNSNNVSITKTFCESYTEIYKESSESVLISKFCGNPTISSNLSLISTKEKDIDSLFDIESVNLYRNDAKQHKQICEMITSLNNSEESIQKLESRVLEDLKDVLKFVDTHQQDGYIGWTRNDLTYTCVLNCLVSLQMMGKMQNTKLWKDSLNEFKHVSTRLNIHPLLETFIDY
ncbi:tRNA (cytidine(32)-2'-O)-methyltransferase non-catalytic subunit Trm732p [[Candida] anglica]|uniref:tRNA (Cytidine(32)-2'-O)-methyltransferase non-catalytic subunit Trm732p n=1 Tax=[Candida] anglica TaxID=148631 RepID=A0ABP0EF55_9ASCO